VPGNLFLSLAGAGLSSLVKAQAMPLELAVAAGSALLALVLVCARALWHGSDTPEVDEGGPWRFVDGKIDEHIEELVAAWREAGSAEAAAVARP
jgi:hypothetical protein